MFGRKRVPTPMPPFSYFYRGVKVQFDPEDLKILMDFNVNVFINDEKVELDREESMRFMREYFAYLDRNQ